jgi:hypothetical protein
MTNSEGIQFSQKYNDLLGRVVYNPFMECYMVTFSNHQKILLYDTEAFQLCGELAGPINSRIASIAVHPHTGKIYILTYEGVIIREYDGALTLHDDICLNIHAGGFDVDMDGKCVFSLPHSTFRRETNEVYLCEVNEIMVADREMNYKYSMHPLENVKQIIFADGTQVTWKPTIHGAFSPRIKRLVRTFILLWTMAGRSEELRLLSKDVMIYELCFLFPSFSFE